MDSLRASNWLIYYEAFPRSRLARDFLCQEVALPEFGPGAAYTNSWAGRVLMRKHLKTVPVYIPVGDVPVDSADQAVAEDRAQSLRGKALLLLNGAALERLLCDLDVDQEIVAMILRAAARVEAEKAARSAAQESATQDSGFEVH
jgi:hypothetical protein